MCVQARVLRSPYTGIQWRASCVLLCTVRTRTLAHHRALAQPLGERACMSHITGTRYSSTWCLEYIPPMIILECSQARHPCSAETWATAPAEKARRTRKQPPLWTSNLPGEREVLQRCPTSMPRALHSQGDQQALQASCSHAAQS